MAFVAVTTVGLLVLALAAALWRHLRDRLDEALRLIDQP